MSFDSAEILNPEYGYLAFVMLGTNIDNHRDFLRNGNYEQLSGFGDVTYYLGLSDGEWHSGDPIETTYLATGKAMDHATPDIAYMSHAKKLGNFPLGCITDGQGFAYDADYYESTSPYPVNGSGDFTINIGERNGTIAFLPNAQFKNGHPTPVGFIPRASEWEDGKDGFGFGMAFLIFINSELIDYATNGNSSIGVPNSGGAIGVTPNLDFRPQAGHIHRLIPHRRRRSFNGEFTVPPDTSGTTTIDLGVLAAVDLNALNSLIGVDVNASQFRAADNTWFTFRSENMRGVVGYSQSVPPVQAPGDMFYILDGLNAITYIIHGTVVA